jgi:transcriptional regulator of acetoin/glycerol metabolism
MSTSEQPRMTGPAPLRTREQVLAALETAGTVSGAARLLSVSRITVYGYLDRYGITAWTRPARTKRVA